MADDPVQSLIDAGAIPDDPFGPNSRYHGVALAVHVSAATGSLQPYVKRRFIPQRRDIAIAAEHVVRGLERPDLLATQALGDPELYWRVADANTVTDPFELTDVAGARVLIPLPPGL